MLWLLSAIAPAYYVNWWKSHLPPAQTLSAPKFYVGSLRMLDDS